MAEEIIDGTGTGFSAKVDGNNQVHTFSVTETEAVQAVDLGNAYNLNTGNVIISGSSAMLYMKSDEDETFVVNAIAIGIGQLTGAAVASDIAEVTIVRNPSTGTLIDSASALPQNQNRNFGSSKELKTTTLTYKGGSGADLTDGNNIAQFYQGHGGRLFAQIDFELERGSSIGIVIDPQLTAGGVKAYCAIVGYVKSSLNQ